LIETGLFVGKFLPPHLGHLWSIKEAAGQCKKLYVLVCDNPETTVPFCKEAGWPLIGLDQRVEWVKQQACALENVTVLGMDESGIRMLPFDWIKWADRVKQTIGERIGAIFGSEASYLEGYKKHFPESQYILQDPERRHVSIHGTQIRRDLEGKLSYVMPAAYDYFKGFLKDG